jgi:hypothetical protein
MGHITKDQAQDITNEEARKCLPGLFGRILAGNHGLPVGATGKPVRRRTVANHPDPTAAVWGRWARLRKGLWELMITS